MDALKFIDKLTAIIKQTGITEVAFTVEDYDGDHVMVTKTPGVFVFRGFHGEKKEAVLLVGGSKCEDETDEIDSIGGKHDLLK
jgi:hypothetical protein